MSVGADLCFRCKGGIRNAFTCDKCNKSFHQSCARGYIKNRLHTDCCRKKFTYLLQPLAKSSRSRLETLRSTGSNHSSSSFKSAASSLDSPYSISDKGSRSNLKSLISPTPVSPVSDSIFTSPISKTVMATTNSNASIGPPFSLTSSSTKTLPSDSSALSIDQKLTSLMESILSKSQAVAKIPAMNEKFERMVSKFDDLIMRIDSLQLQQSSITEDINTNSENIHVLKNKLNSLENNVTENSKFLLEQLTVIKSQNLTISTSTPNSELVVAGVPDVISSNL